MQTARLSHCHSAVDPAAMWLTPSQVCRVRVPTEDVPVRVLCLQAWVQPAAAGAAGIRRRAAQVGPGLWGLARSRHTRSVQHTQCSTLSSNSPVHCLINSYKALPLMNQKHGLLQAAGICRAPTPERHSLLLIPLTTPLTLCHPCTQNSGSSRPTPSRVCHRTCS